MHAANKIYLYLVQFKTIYADNVVVKIINDKYIEINIYPKLEHIARLVIDAKQNKTIFTLRLISNKSNSITFDNEINKKEKKVENEFVDVTSKILYNNLCEININHRPYFMELYIPYNTPTSS